MHLSNLFDPAVILESSAMLVTQYFSGNKPRTLSEEVLPMPSEDQKGVLPRLAYSALMGLLSSSGATLLKGPNNWHFPRSTVLKLSSFSPATLGKTGCSVPSVINGFLCSLLRVTPYSSYFNQRSIAIFSRCKPGFILPLHLTDALATRGFTLTSNSF